MKKVKFSWQYFLFTILVIVLLGCLVYYLEQNKVIEAFEKNSKTSTAHNLDEIKKASSKKKKSSNKEGFRNLTYAPVSSTGPKPGCQDSLKPYNKYKCGPVDVNNFFGGLKFKPECCGNPAGSSYSNSVGCACMCPEQLNYLNSRGGNRTFPTEY